MYLLVCRCAKPTWTEFPSLPGRFMDLLIRVFESPDNALAMCLQLSSVPHYSTLRAVSMVPGAKLLLMFSSSRRRVIYEQSTNKARTITVQKTLSIQ